VPPGKEEGAGGQLDDAPSRQESSARELDEALARARPTEGAGLRVIHARLTHALFGSGPLAELGRFRVLERLGEGGMGVVYAAYDPELDRGVALKVVRIVGDRDQALAESKALARLSHPHVVPIYDVGVDGDLVYIAMELVRGETLRAWQRGRPAREVLDAYRQAGEALAAAHAAGLVHRDFKPDNAIVGRDGRLRVVDFGLACEVAVDSAHAGAAVAGTPRYMAPEQARGAPVTTAADQYSFCAALEEALTPEAAGPLPRWLIPILQRGRAADPADRFPSMSDLLRALARDPARLRRWRFGLALSLALGAVAFLAGRATLGGDTDECGGGRALLESTWPSPDREGAMARLTRLGQYGRQLAPRLRSAIDEHARRWLHEHRAACLADRRGVDSRATTERRMMCVDGSRSALAEVADLVSRAGPAQLPDLPLAVHALPDPTSCGDRAALASTVEPPPLALAAEVGAIRGRLERARVQIAAGRLQEAADLAGRLADQARRIAYRPALAEALLVRGHAALIMQRRDEAIVALQEATALAWEVGADDLAIEAWARRAWLEGTGGSASALEGLEVVEAIARRTRSARFARALLYNNAGSVELAYDRRARARSWFERAVAESRGVTGPGAIELITARSNLALVTEDRRDQDAQLAEVVSDLVRLLAPDHPQVLWAQEMRANTSVQNLSAAATLLDRTCEALDAQPALAAHVVRCWAELGMVRKDLGDDPGAVLAMERADRRLAAAPSMAEVRPYLLLWRGDARAALAGFEGALAALPSAGEESWFPHFRRAEVQVGLGRALRATGDLRGARTTLENAVAELAPIAERHPSSLIERRLGRARIELAQVLADVRASDTAVAEAARAGVAWLREVGGQDAEIAFLQRLAGRR
jgi:tetratricopeptide (TPR) repeat protein/predicted Ser/Thr protein kinase